jgi:hypothetical protein
LGALLRQLVAEHEPADLAPGLASTVHRSSWWRRYPARPSAVLIGLSERTTHARTARVRLTVRGLADALAAFPGATLPRRNAQGGGPTSERAWADRPATDWHGPPTQASPRPFFLPDRRFRWAALPACLERARLTARRPILARIAVAGLGLAGLRVIGLPALDTALRSVARAGRTPPRPTGTQPSASAASTPASSAGGVWQLGANRYSVGAPGDVILTGRWTCGPPTVAVVRPRDGTVWVFPTVPSPPSSIAAALVGRVGGVTTGQSRPVGQCDVLVAHRADGSTTQLGPWQHGP